MAAPLSADFSPNQINTILRIVSDAQKGRYPGFGNPQVDTYNYPDNCTATFPWNFDFVIPKNFQRWTSVHLSFKLRAFRRYVSGANTGTSSTSLHFHTWVIPTGTIASNVGVSAGTALVSPGGPSGMQTATESPAGGAGFSATTSIDTSGPGHTHTLTPTLITGIFEDTSPTSVSIKIDGVDQTAALAGPWTTDTVELDLTKVMPTTTNVFHTISLTPDQNGRITGELRFSYFVDASVSA